MKKARGFTLLEIIVVLAIVGLIFGATTMVSTGVDEEALLRRPYADVRAMAKRAWMRALQEQRAWQIRIHPDRFVLEPRRAVNQEDQRVFAEADAAKERGSGVEVMKLPDGVTAEVRHWGEPQWRTPRPDAWVFEHSGLTEPISIRLRSGYGVLSAQWEPLSASVREEEFQANTD